MRTAIRSAIFSLQARCSGACASAFETPTWSRRLGGGRSFAIVQAGASQPTDAASPGARVSSTRSAPRTGSAAVRSRR